MGSTNIYVYYHMEPKPLVSVATLLLFPQTLLVPKAQYQRVNISASFSPNVLKIASLLGLHRLYVVTVRTQTATCTP